MRIYSLQAQALPEIQTCSASFRRLLNLPWLLGELVQSLIVRREKGRGDDVLLKMPKSSGAIYPMSSVSDSEIPVICY